MEKIVLGRDGDLWVAHRGVFGGLQESAVGYGETKEDAIEDLKINETK